MQNVTEELNVYFLWMNAGSLGWLSESCWNLLPELNLSLLSRPLNIITDPSKITLCHKRTQTFLLCLVGTTKNTIKLSDDNKILTGSHTLF